MKKKPYKNPGRKKNPNIGGFGLSWVKLLKSVVKNMLEELQAYGLGAFDNLLCMNFYAITSVQKDG